MATNKQMLMAPLKPTLNVPSDIESSGDATKHVSLLSDDAHGQHHGTDDYDAVMAHMLLTHPMKDPEVMEQAINDHLEEADIDNVRFMTCATLLHFDESSGTKLKSVRSHMKLVLLPCIQVLVPFGLCYYLIVQRAIFQEQGYCPNDDSFIFRATGFVVFIYSGWQIIDGDEDCGAKYFMKFSVRRWAIMGGSKNLKSALCFFLCRLKQQLCSLLLLFTTYIVFTSGDTPLDLLMNCVAINFVLDLGSEWMDAKKASKAKTSARAMYESWVNETTAQYGEESARANMKKHKFIRSRVAWWIDGFEKIIGKLIPVIAYSLIVTWSFCPASW